MTRRLALLLLLLFATLLLQSAPARPAAAQAPAAVEKVDCHKGESVNKALVKQPGSAALVVEIEGTCHENVVVTRDRVTLLGSDPATDGIQAIANTTQTDAAVWVRGAQLVTVENLKLSGGFTGLTATDANLPFLRMRNCRVEGNAQFGVQLEVGLLTAEDTTFGPNARFNVGVFAGSRFECRGCTLTLTPTTDVRDNVIAATASQVILFDSTLVNGGVNAGNATVSVADSTIEAFAAPNAAAVVAGASSAVNLIRTQIEGPLRFFTGTTANLAGVTQTPGVAPAGPNILEDAAYVRISPTAPFCASPPCPPAPPVQSFVGGFNVNSFSNLSLLGGSQLDGNIGCLFGGNAFCQFPSNISGTANCQLCTKP